MSDAYNNRPQYTQNTVGWTPTGSRKFGKHPARHDPRTLKLAKYLTPALTPPPERVNWSRGFNFNWGAMLNQDLGDCTIAACGHAIQTWSLDNGRMITLPDADILTGYECACGYVVGDPSMGS